MGQADKKRQSKETTRRCIATGEVLSCDVMVRFVLAPDGVVTPDVAGKLPGRGLWVSANKTALATAIKKNAFSRAAKTQAKVPDGLAALVDELVLKRMIDLISLARRNGSAICGFEKIKSALMNDQVVTLIQANDGSEQQKRKLRPPEGRNSYISCLSAAELGLAFGRDYVIHAALAGGGLTRSVKRDAARLAGLRGEDAMTDKKQLDNPAVKR